MFTPVKSHLYMCASPYLLLVLHELGTRWASSWLSASQLRCGQQRASPIWFPWPLWLYITNTPQSLNMLYSVATSWAAVITYGSVLPTTNTPPQKMRTARSSGNVPVITPLANAYASSALTAHWRHSSDIACFAQKNCFPLCLFYVLWATACLKILNKRSRTLVFPSKRQLWGDLNEGLPLEASFAGWSFAPATHIAASHPRCRPCWCPPCSTRVQFQMQIGREREAMRRSLAQRRSQV